MAPTRAASADDFFALDLSTAFDTISHRYSLLTDCRPISGVTSSALRWLESYVGDRRQCVKISGHSSLVSAVLPGSDVSIYKSDFNFDYFHVTKFDLDLDFFDIRMRCYLTWLFLLNQFIKTYFSSSNCQFCQLQFT
jgi:hypothetical protein